MPILKKIVDFLEKGIDALVTAMMIVMGVSIVIQVFARYVLNNPTGWSEELARYIFVWITLLGSAVVLKRGKHVEVGYLVERAPPRVQKVLGLAAQLGVLIFLCVLLVSGIGLTGVGHRQVSAAMELPMSIMYAALPAGAFFMILFLVAELIGQLIGTRRAGMPSHKERKETGL